MGISTRNNETVSFLICLLNIHHLLGRLPKKVIDREETYKGDEFPVRERDRIWSRASQGPSGKRTQAPGLQPSSVLSPRSPDPYRSAPSGAQLTDSNAHCRDSEPEPALHLQRQPFLSNNCWPRPSQN